MSNRKYHEEIIIVPNEDNEEQQSSSPFGFLIVIWFVASLGGLIYFGKINELYTVMVFGQYFLVFGIMSFSKLKKEPYVPIIMTIIGLACIVVPLAMLNEDKLSFKPDWELIIGTLVLLGLTIAGLAIVIITLYKHQKSTKQCTASVTAKVTKIDKYFRNGAVLYQAVLAYEYEGSQYEIRKTSYNMNEFHLNDYMDLNIDPNNPSISYEKDRNYLYLIIFGLIFGLGSLLTFLVFISQYY